MKKSPFELDHTLLRYLSDIEFFYDSKQTSIIDADAPLKHNQILVNRFDKEDSIDHDTETRFERFIKYFESIEALRFHSYAEYYSKYISRDPNNFLGSYTLRDPYKEVVYEKSLLVEVLKVEAIREFRKKYAENEIFLPGSSTGKIVREFDVIHDDGCLFCHGERYKPTSKRRRKLVTLLWTTQMGQRKKISQLSPKLLACRLYELDSAKDVTSAQVKQVLDDIKSINSQLKSKEIPVRVQNLNDLIQIRISKRVKK